MKNIINDLTKYILSRFPTNEVWARICALVILAVVLGKERKIYITTGEFRCNLYSVCIGPSQLAYKSTPMDEIVVPILRMLGKELMKNSDYFLLPHDYSFEGLIELMVDRPATDTKPAYKGRKEGLLKKDEFSAFLKSAKKKGWQVDAYEILSRLYDGYEISRYTKGSKEERVKGHFVNVLAATTQHAYQSLDEGFFNQGLGNRMLWVVNEPKLEELLAFDDRENIFEMGTSQIDPDKFNKIHRKFVKRLKRINNYAPHIISVMSGAPANRMAQIKRHFLRQSHKYYDESKHDLRTSFVFTSWTFVLKIAALNAIARLEPHFGNEPQMTNVIITTNDINQAFKQVRKHIKYFEQMLREWTEASMRQPVKTDVADWDLVIGHIRNAGGEIATGELFTATGKNWKKFGEIINDLLVDDRILFKKEGKKKIYYLPK